MAGITQVSRKERQKFWKIHHAQSCMAQVLQLTDELKEANLKKDSSLFYASMIGMYVLYSRPFNQLKGVNLSKDQYVPKNLHHDHKIAIDIRNKMAAHVEVGENALKTSDGELLVNMMLWVNGKEITTCMSALTPRDKGLELSLIHI